MSDKIYALAIMVPHQKAPIEDHCFGDCGKISMAGAVEIDLLGPCFVCCEQECPHQHKVSEEPFGKSALTGDDVYVRVLNFDKVKP